MADLTGADGGLRELALFAGAGGGILGGKLLGWRTVCAVERDAYAAQVLAQRQNDGVLEPFPVWSDVCSFDGRPWRGIVDIISGGFPCQDISSAGKGAGITGARSGLWGEFARIIGEVRPRFVFVENSPMLTSRGLGRVLGDLATLGFDAEWCVLGADDAGAPHIRKRIWILANTRGGRFGEQGYGEDQFSRGTEAECPGFDVAHPPGPRLPPGQPCACGEIRDEARGPESERRSGHVAHPAGLRRVKGWPESKRLEGRPDAIQRGPSIPHAMREGLEEWDGGSGKAGSCAAPVVGDWWATEPAMDRVAHGVAHRVDRLKAIGNGQVPQVAELAFRTLYGRLIGDTHE